MESPEPSIPQISLNVPNNIPSLNYSMIQNLGDLTVSNCIDYWQSLTNNQRGVLEKHIKVKINNFNFIHIPKPPNSALITDKFYFFSK